MPGNLHADTVKPNFASVILDPVPGSGVLGVIIEAPTTETSGAALAAANSSSKGSEEERLDSGCL